MSNVSAIHLHEALKAKGLRIVHTTVPTDYNIIDDGRDQLIHKVVVASAREQEFLDRIHAQPAS